MLDSQTAAQSSVLQSIKINVKNSMSITLRMVDISHAFKTAKIIMIDPKMCVSLSDKNPKNLEIPNIRFFTF